MLPSLLNNHGPHLRNLNSGALPYRLPTTDCEPHSRLVSINKIWRHSHCRSTMSKTAVIGLEALANWNCCPVYDELVSLM